MKRAMVSHVIAGLFLLVSITTASATFLTRVDVDVVTPGYQLVRTVVLGDTFVVNVEVLSETFITPEPLDFDTVFLDLLFNEITPFLGFTGVVLTGDLPTFSGAPGLVSDVVSGAFPIVLGGPLTMGASVGPTFPVPFLDSTGGYGLGHVGPGMFSLLPDEPGVVFGVELVALELGTAFMVAVGAAGPTTDEFSLDGDPFGAPVVLFSRVIVTPEPTTLLLSALGFMCVMAYAWWRDKRLSRRDAPSSGLSNSGP